MTTKLNGISELLALFPLPPPLAESAVNHRSSRGSRLRYQRACVRTPAKPSLVSADPAISVSMCQRARFTALMRTEKRRTYSARGAMVRTITHPACSPFRFVGVYS